jgi:hypothetical protein
MIKIRDDNNTNICGCKTVNPLIFFKDFTGAILYHEAQSFMYDKKWGIDPQYRQCDIGQIVSIGIDPKTIRNTFGVISMVMTNEPFLDLSEIITGIKVNRVNILIINDLSNVCIFRVKHNNKIVTFDTINEMSGYVHKVFSEYVTTIIFL